MSTNADISFRPIEDQDLDFLRRVYASTREDELQLVPWDDAAKEAFLSQQFQAQHVHYQRYYPDARFDVIVHEQTPIGRLYVDRSDDEIRVIDIALLTEYRGRRIGGTIMHDLLDEAAAAGKTVTIHVERNNPAMRLYERLGFRKLEDKEVYWLMEWKHESANGNAQLQEGE